MSYIAHNNGLVEQVSEVGFDQVKYFEGNITSTPFNLAIDPPAKRLTIVNRDDTNSVYLNVTGIPATTTVGLVPGDNIKISSGCSFSMDFDSLENISLVTSGPTVAIEGLLGFKGSTHHC